MKVTLQMIAVLLAKNYLWGAALESFTFKRVPLQEKKKKGKLFTTTNKPLEQAILRIIFREWKLLSGSHSELESITPSIREPTLESFYRQIYSPNTLSTYILA